MYRKKRLKTLTAGVLLFALIAGAMIILPSTQVEAEEYFYSETNPELTMYKINSDLEKNFYGYSARMHDSELITGGSSDYIIRTNSMAAWTTEDDIAFAAQEYNVCLNEGDYFEATVTIDKPMTPTNEGDLVHRSATAGIMIRTGLDPSASMAFFGWREGGVVAVYRTNDGVGTGSLDDFGKELEWPLQIKVRKEGIRVTFSYVNKMGIWTELRNPAMVKGDGSIYVGLAFHSHNPDMQNDAYFSDYKIDGHGTYVPGQDEDDDKDNEVEKPYVVPDSPIPDDVLLRETFSDYDLYNEAPADASESQKKAYPVWTRTSREKPVMMNENGNVFWDLSGEILHNYFGDQMWTDYEVSADFFYTDYCNKTQLNKFALYFRHTDVPFYGNADYRAQIVWGNLLEVKKNAYIADDADEELTLAAVDLSEYYNDPDYNCIGDGTWHNLRVTVVDNIINVYYDDDHVVQNLVDQVNDSGLAYGEKETARRVLAKGNVGIMVNETSLYLDNITVTKLTDSFGGDFDNYIGGNWNEPMPTYIEALLAKYKNQFTYY